jgi:HSP20 family molecular chaperone IbpA
VRRPRLRSSSYRKGVLSVTVSGVPDFGRAVFTVDTYRYARANGKLRVHLKRPPKKVSVVVDVPGVGRTAALRVNIKTPRQAHRKALKRNGHGADCR